MKNKRFKIMIVMLLLLFSISIGYALISSNLSINGNANINNPKWDIHFENVQVKSGSVTTVSQAPTISSDKLSVSYAITLNTPGEFYEFTVDAVNAGTIDGMIESVTSKVNNSSITSLPNYIDYSITYLEGDDIAPNHLLPHSSSTTYKVYVGFKKDITIEDLPNSSETLNFEFTVSYIQSNDSAIARNVVYSAPPNIAMVNIGEELPESVTKYDTYSAALASFDHNFFLKHVLYNNVVTKSFVGFLRGGKDYYLEGGINEYDLSEKPVYERNKQILLEAYGEENCTISNYETECNVNSYEEFAKALISGSVRAADKQWWHCFIRSGSYCDNNPSSGF